MQHSCLTPQSLMSIPVSHANEWHTYGKNNNFVLACLQTHAKLQCSCLFCVSTMENKWYQTPHAEQNDFLSPSISLFLQWPKTELSVSMYNEEHRYTHNLHRDKLSYLIQEQKQSNQKRSRHFCFHHLILETHVFRIISSKLDSIQTWIFRVNTNQLSHS